MKTYAPILVGVFLGPVHHAAADPQPACEDRMEAMATGEAVTGAEPIGVIHFAPGSNRIASSAASSIDGAVDWLERYPRRLLIVEGHADRTGSWSANLRLSQERADRVRDELVEQGADPIRIVVTAHGENRTVGDPRCSRRVVMRGTVHSYSELISAQREIDAGEESSPRDDRPAQARPAPPPRR